MKLLIGIPSLDFMHAEFVQSLVALIKRLNDAGIKFDVEIQSGTLVYIARDRIADKAIAGGYTHVLWLDSDMVFTPDVLDALTFSGKSFVCGIFHARRKGYHSCIFKKAEVGDIQRFDEYPIDTFEIDACGFGCVLIETEILARVRIRCKSCFLPMASFGEDIAFCKRAKELGYQIYAEPSAVLGHIGHITIYPEDHEKWKREISNYEKVR